MLVIGAAEADTEQRCFAEQSARDPLSVCFHARSMAKLAARPRAPKPRPLGVAAGEVAGAEKDTQHEGN